MVSDASLPYRRAALFVAAGLTHVDGAFRWRPFFAAFPLFEENFPAAVRARRTASEDARRPRNAPTRAATMSFDARGLFRSSDDV